MNRAFALLLVLPLLAGCVSDDGAADAPEPADVLQQQIDALGTDWIARALQSDTGGDHDHRDWTQHTGMSTPNFQELAHHPLALEQFNNRTAGGYFCGGATTTEDGRRISVIESFDTNVAFSVIDATDPYHPVHLGDFLLDFAQTYDIDLTADGKHVVMAANAPTEQQPEPGSLARLVDAPTVTGRAGWRDACTGQVTYGPEQTVAAGPSTIMANIEDPSNPTFEFLSPEPVLGPHSVSTATIDGTTYVVSSITNLVHHASYFHFYEVVDTPAGSILQHLSLMDAGLVGDVTQPLNGHIDAEIAKHPVTGQTVVYLSDWGGGLAVLDFSVPQAPLPLGTWKDALPDGGAVHSTFSIPDAQVFPRPVEHVPKAVRS